MTASACLSAKPNELQAIAGPCSTQQQAALAPLINALQTRLGRSLMAIIYYGSCLRDGDPTSGLVDFYVIVDSYRQAHERLAPAVFNALLPPNVYYLEQASSETQTLRCKYALISEADLARGVSSGFLPGLWGRFSQPVAIVHACSDEAQARIRTLCGQAVVSLLEQTLPALEPPDSAARTFARALTLSYGGEMRVESGQRSRQLVQGESAEYARRLHAAAPFLAFAVATLENGCIDWQPTAAQCRTAARRWPTRRAAGRAHSVARLAKACCTFSNAVDYGAWKLERHTGVHIDVTPKLRRYPLIYAWPVLWRLYRQGALR